MAIKFEKIGGLPVDGDKVAIEPLTEAENEEFQVLIDLMEDDEEDMTEEQIARHQELSDKQEAAEAAQG